VSDPGPSWEDRQWLTQDQATSLFYEIENRVEAYGQAHFHSMILQPGDSRLVWVASHAYLPYPARKGKPYCELIWLTTKAELTLWLFSARVHMPAVPPNGLLRLRPLARDGLGMLNRLPSDGHEPEPIDLSRFEGWTIKVVDALEDQPEILAKFESTLARGTEPGAAQIAHSIKTLVEIVRDLEAHKPS